MIYLGAGLMLVVVRIWWWSRTEAEWQQWKALRVPQGER